MSKFKRRIARATAIAIVGIALVAVPTKTATADAGVCYSSAHYGSPETTHLLSGVDQTQGGWSNQYWGTWNDVFQNWVYGPQQWSRWCHP